MAVIGAGLAGATCACLFARAGFRVAVVEARAAEAPAAAGRVVALNLATRNLFTELEIWRKIPSMKICPYRSMKIWDAHTTARISFTAAAVGQDCLGFIAENRAIQHLLWEKLAHHDRVQIMDAAELVGVAQTESGLNLTLRAASTGAARADLQAKLLVGADGGDSAVKKLCGLATRARDFAQDAIIATVDTARGHANTALQCFLRTGPVAMLPLRNKQCAVVWSCDREFADKLMAESEKEFAARLQTIFGEYLGDLSMDDRNASAGRRRFPLAARAATRYIAPHTALIGDAAHVVHPLAGLGANLGLADAAALVEVAADARARGLAIGQRSVLRRYERRRRVDNAVALQTLTFAKEIFGSSNPVAQFIRRAGMNTADRIAPIKHTLARLASGRYGDAPAVLRGLRTEH